MSALLASDLNNPEFTGAVANPDALLFVEFYWHTPIDKWATEEESLKAGRRVVIYKKKLKFEPGGSVSKTDEDDKQIWIRIMRPGDQTSIIERQMHESDKQRWPDKWIYWEMAEGLRDDGAGIPGWKIEDWPHLDGQPTLIRDLRYMRFYTVELIAGAADAQVQKMGIGGPGLREQARSDLRNKMAKDLTSEITARDKVIAEQGAALAALQKQMADVLEQVTKPKAK